MASPQGLFKFYKKAIKGKGYEEFFRKGRCLLSELDGSSGKHRKKKEWEQIIFSNFLLWLEKYEFIIVPPFPPPVLQIIPLHHSPLLGDGKRIVVKKESDGFHYFFRGRFVRLEENEKNYIIYTNLGIKVAVYEDLVTLYLPRHVSGLYNHQLLSGKGEKILFFEGSGEVGMEEEEFSLPPATLFVTREAIAYVESSGGAWIILLKS